MGPAREMDPLRQDHTAAADEERYAIARKLLLESFRGEPRVSVRMFMLHYGVTIAPLVFSVLLCAAYPRVWTYILAAIVAGSVANGLGLLMHEGSHYFFHPDKKTNDLLANVLVCLPIFNTVAGYRGPHLDHHRHSGTPLDPYERLYRGYRGGLDVAIRLLGDLMLVSSIERFAGRYLGQTDKTVAPLTVTTLGALVLVQGSLFGLYAVVTGWYWSYVVLWLLPLMTVPQVVNRIRTIAEHGPGPAQASANRGTDPTWVEYLLVAPYGYAFHFEHHLVPSIPYYCLESAHRLLRQQGFTFGTNELTGGYWRAFIRVVRLMR